MTDDKGIKARLTDNLALLSPEGWDQLTPDQKIEVNKFLIEKITASDELLGAVSRKVKSFLHNKK